MRSATRLTPRLVGEGGRAGVIDRRKGRSFGACEKYGRRGGFGRPNGLEVRPVTGYIIRRLIAGVLVLLAVTFVVFMFFFYGPSDPALAYCPKGTCTGDDLARIRANLGLDQPVMQQYGEYLKGIVAGREIAFGSNVLQCDMPCLGWSFKYSVAVTLYLMSLFPATLSIAIGAAVVFLTVGVAVGIISARKRGSSLDRGLVGFVMFTTAMPYYLVALLAFLYLSSRWGLFPEPGFSAFTDGDRKSVV